VKYISYSITIIHVKIHVRNNPVRSSKLEIVEVVIIANTIASCAATWGIVPIKINFVDQLLIQIIVRCSKIQYRKRSARKRKKSHGMLHIN